jgi:hypothetical protein
VRESGWRVSQPVTSRTVGGAGGSGAALVEVAADDGVAAGVAECFDLPEQLGAVAAALAGALVQVRLERVQLAGPRLLPAAVGEFLPGGGAGVALDGVQAPAQVPGDLPQAAALVQQVVHDRVVPPGPVCVLPGRLRPLGLCHSRGRPGFICGSG